MTKQLQECINSGQVSAAQMVAHADAGDLPQRLMEACNGHPHALIPWPHRLLHEAAEALEARRLDRDEWKDATVIANERFKKAEAALEAERERFADLMAVVNIVLIADTTAALNGGGAHARHVIPAIQEMRKTRAKLTATQEQKP